MAFSGAEKRRHERVKRALAMQFRLKKSTQKNADTDTWHLSMTTDMSASGVAFESTIPLLLGDMIEIQVVMSGVLDVIKGEGKIVRTKEKKSGQMYIIAAELKKHL